MAGTSARVNSVETLKIFRIALIKFAEMCGVALTDAESEMQRLIMWVELEQVSYWTQQNRKRHEDVMRCKEAVRMKKLFKGSDGRTQSAVDEEKALAIAVRRLAEAEAKLKATQAWSRKLSKEVILYKGQTTRFATALSSDIPTAIAKLAALVTTLEQYMALSVGTGGGGADGPMVTSKIDSMASMMTRGDHVPPEEGSRRWRYLRARTPAGDARGAAASLPGFVLQAAELTSSETEKVLAASPQRLAPDPQSKVVVAHSTARMNRVYLHRTDPSFPGDSGWYIGPADDAEADPGGSVTVEEVLGARPDLRDMLTLPVGYLAVLDGGGVSGLLDETDQDKWKT